MNRSAGLAVAAILVALAGCGPSQPAPVGVLKRDREIIRGPGWGDREVDVGDRKVKVRARVWTMGQEIPADQLPVFDENGDGKLDAADPTFAHSVGVKAWRWGRTKIVPAVESPALTVTSAGAAKANGKLTRLYAFEDFILAIPESLPPGAKP